MAKRKETLLELMAKKAAIDADTAAIFSSLLGLDVPCNRATFQLKEGVTLFVGQYKGPRLPEGATSLPEGATVEWAMVLVVID